MGDIISLVATIAGGILVGYVIYLCAPVLFGIASAVLEVTSAISPILEGISLLQNIKKKDIKGLFFNAVMMYLNFATFGLTRGVKEAESATSHLSKLVRQGGKITEEMQIGSIKTKSLRMAAQEALRLQEKAKNSDKIVKGLTAVKGIGQSVIKLWKGEK